MVNLSIEAELSDLCFCSVKAALISHYKAAK